MMKIFSIYVFISCFSIIVHAESKKPNFVFFLVDDMGWGDLGAYGSKLHETPNIDKLALDGMKFTQAYSACTVCSPSRAAIITGRYPGRLHLTDWIAGHNRPKAKLKVPNWKMEIDHGRVTMPEALKVAGYSTEFIGKWHLMPHLEKEKMKQHFPENHGFDINIGGREWGQPKGRGKYFFPFDMPNIEGEEGDYLTDVLTDKAVEFIDGQSAEKPFLLYFSYYVVHGPLMAKKEYVQKYKKKLAAGDYKQKNPVYAGMMQSLDDSVGRVLEALEKNGLSENTIVIFTADNGGTNDTKSGGLRGHKGLSYEGGTRVANIIKWPGSVKAGSSCDVPVVGTDFYPTILEMAGLKQKPEEHKDGLSMVPLLKQTGTLDRETLYWHYPHYHKTLPYAAVRHKDYKLIEFFEDGKLELYDLKKDSKESVDLSKLMPEKTQELLAMMKTWRQDVNAQMMTENPDYDPNAKKNKKSKRKK